MIYPPGSIFDLGHRDKPYEFVAHSNVSLAYWFRFSTKTCWCIYDIDLSLLVRGLACHIFDAEPLPEPMLACCQLGPKNKISEIFKTVQMIMFVDEGYSI